MDAKRKKRMKEEELLFDQLFGGKKETKEP